MPASPADGSADTVANGDGVGGAVVETGVNAGSPAASQNQDENNAPSMLDAVKAALKQDEPEKSSGSEDTGKKEPVEGDLPADAKDGADGEPLGELTDEELDRYHSKTRRRIKALIGERDTYRSKAEGFDKITSYIEGAGLTTSEVNTGFEVMRLLKNDPHEALKRLAPIVDTLRQVTGAVLPNDLQQRVALGRLPEDAAAELAQARSREQLAEQAAQRAREAADRRMADQAQRAQADAAAAVSEWERTWAASDPDYPKVKQLVQERIELDVLKAAREGRSPRDARGAVALADKARAAVKASLAQFTPKPRAVVPVLGGGNTGGAAPVPTTALEAAKAGLAALGA